MKIFFVFIIIFLPNCGATSFQQSVFSSPSQGGSENETGEQVESLDVVRNVDSLDGEGTKQNLDEVKEESQEIMVSEAPSKKDKKGKGKAASKQKENKNEAIISEPIMVLGSYLTSCIVSDSVVTCDLNPENPITAGDYEKIILSDSDGNDIPPEDTRFDLVMVEGVQKLLISVANDHKVASISEKVEPPDPEISSQDSPVEEQDSPVEEEEAIVQEEPDPTDTIINDNNVVGSKVEIIEQGISARITTTKLIEFIGVGALTATTNINFGNASVSKEDFVVTIQGLNNLELPIDLYLADGEIESYSPSELRGEILN